MEPTSLPLLPDTAALSGGELTLAGIRASKLAREFGTPLVVYDELTLVEQARAYRAAAPGALVVYGTKAFPSLALLRLSRTKDLAPTSPRPASSRSRSAPASRANVSSCTATTKRTSCCVKRPH